MTKPMTSSSRREFIAKAREHLKNMRAALVHERAFAIRAARSSAGGDTMDSADLASEEFDRHVSDNVSLSAKAIALSK